MMEKIMKMIIQKRVQQKQLNWRNKILRLFH